MKSVEALIVLLIMVPLTGVILWLFWGWFVVPALSAPPITFWAAIGLRLVAQVAIGPFREKQLQEPQDDPFIERLFIGAGAWGLVLALGWFVASVGDFEA